MYRWYNKTSWFFTIEHLYVYISLYHISKSWCARALYRYHYSHIYRYIYILYVLLSTHIYLSIYLSIYVYIYIYNNTHNVYTSAIFAALLLCRTSVIFQTEFSRQVTCFSAATAEWPPTKAWVWRLRRPSGGDPAVTGCVTRGVAAVWWSNFRYPYILKHSGKSPSIHAKEFRSHGPWDNLWWPWFLLVGRYMLFFAAANLMEDLSPENGLYIKS